MDNEGLGIINTLLGFLRGFEVVSLVDKCFLEEHNNPAPGELLRSQIDKAQKYLERYEIW